MLDEEAHRTLEAAWARFQQQMEDLHRQMRAAANQSEGLNARYGSPGGDPQAAYLQWKRQKAIFRETANELEQKKSQLRREWNRLVMSYGLPPRFPDE